MQRGVAQIPWRHNIALLEKLKQNEERFWYIEQTIKYGWARDVLVHQIAGGLFHRQGKAITNFTHALPSPQSELAQATLKDPYIFDFLTLTKEAGGARITNITPLPYSKIPLGAWCRLYVCGE